MQDEDLKAAAYPQIKPPEHDGYYVVPQYAPWGVCPLCKVSVIWILADNGGMLPLDLGYARINAADELEARTHVQTCTHRQRWQNQEWKP